MKKIAKIMSVLLVAFSLLPMQSFGNVLGSTSTNSIVINEVQSNDPDGGADWIELANPTSSELDISGVVIKDSKDKDPYTIPEGTKIPANGFLVIKQDDAVTNGFAFGLGKGDSVRLFENGKQIASTTWPADTHTDPTWVLYPDVNGTTYKNTAEAPQALPTSSPTRSRSSTGLAATMSRSTTQRRPS